MVQLQRALKSQFERDQSHPLMAIPMERKLGIRQIAMTFLTLMLVACASKPVEHKSGSFVFDDGFNDSFSSRTGIYRRLNCTRERRFLDAHIRLTDAEISSILSEADEVDFYHLPKNVVGSSDDGQVEAMMPCASYRLHIETGSFTNEVTWECGYNGPEYSPKQITPLVSRIRKILQSKPEVRGLPKSACLIL